MSNMAKAVLITLATAVVCLGIAVAIFFFPGRERESSSGVGFRNTIDQTETAVLADIDTVIVDTSSTDVHIIVEPVDEVTVRLHGSVRSSSRVALPHLTVEEQGDTLILKVSRKETISFGFYSSDIRLDVTLPESYDGSVSIDTSSGDLYVPLLSVNGFVFDSSSGEAEIGKLSATTVKLLSSSGDVEADIISSSKSLRDSSSGGTRIKRFSGDLDFRSSSGDLSLEYAAFDNNVTINSSSGEIEITLPEDAEFTLDVDTSSGDIETDFPLVVKGKVDEDTLRGRVGQGNGSIRITTSSGDVTISK